MKWVTPGYTIEMHLRSFHIQIPIPAIISQFLESLVLPSGKNKVNIYGLVSSEHLSCAVNTLLGETPFSFFYIVLLRSCQEVNWRLTMSDLGSQATHLG